MSVPRWMPTCPDCHKEAAWLVEVVRIESGLNKRKERRRWLLTRAHPDNTAQARQALIFCHACSAVKTLRACAECAKPAKDDEVLEEVKLPPLRPAFVCAACLDNVRAEFQARLDRRAREDGAPSTEAYVEYETRLTAYLEDTTRRAPYPGARPWKKEAA